MWPARSTRRKIGMALAVSLAALVAIELAVKLGVRLSEPTFIAMDEYRKRWLSEVVTSRSYEPHPYMAYVHPDTLDPFVNRFGFYGEEWTLDKPEGVYRIACFGGSTTAGPQSWPKHLQDVLTEQGMTVETMNFGVGGWTSAESVVAMALLAQDFSPDLVIIHNLNNDIVPIKSEGFLPDYSHFRKVLQVGSAAEMSRQRAVWRLEHALLKYSDMALYLRLWLSGGAPPAFTTVDGLTTRQPAQLPKIPEESAKVYERNLKTIATLAQAQGGEVALATMPWLDPTVKGEGDVAFMGLWTQELRRQNKRAANLARQEDWLVVELESKAWDPALFEDTIHLTSEGNRLKAEYIAERLFAGGRMP